MSLLDDNTSHGLQLLQTYHPALSAYDELRQPDGQIRPHWRTFLARLDDMDEDGRQGRAEKLSRLVRETGIAHDVFADPDTTSQPWDLNLVPLLIAAREWSWLQTAMAQRARLFDAILADIYGPQELLKSGMIPPKLIFSDPAFLPVCAGLYPEGPHLYFYSADLARAPNGAWHVLDNHTETSAGIGFALANRVVVTHGQGELFRKTNVRRLAPYFEGVQQDIISRTGKEAPRIVLLTPGPKHQAYFGHAYYARYMGFQLVEGLDLHVARGRVSLKTLQGLRGIDAIERETEARLSDPLQLDSSGFLGPVGLVQASQRTPGLLINRLGTAIVENRALGAFLPALSTHLLGEDLMLPDIPRTWLGTKAGRTFAEANLETVVIRKVRRGTGRPGVTSEHGGASDLPSQNKEALRRTFLVEGSKLVAEQRFNVATAPTLTSKGLSPRPYALRLYSSHHASDQNDGPKDGYRVMPGGIALTVEPSGSLTLNANSSQTRDVWVLSDKKTETHTSLWTKSIETAHFEREGRDLASRTADNLFWLGRYVERAEWTLRLARAALSRFEDDEGPDEDLDTSGRALGILLGKDPESPLSSGGFGSHGSIEGQVHSILFSTQRSYGLQASLEALHRLAGLTRNRLSVEAWQILNQFHADRGWRSTSAPSTIGETLELINHGIMLFAAFSGLSSENMTKNFGWRFLDLGRRVDRALSLAEMLQQFFARRFENEPENRHLLFALEVADSFMTYRSRYRLNPILPAVIDLLMLDESNPRSLAYQLVAIENHIGSLPQAIKNAPRGAEHKISISLITDLRIADARSLALSDSNGHRADMAGLLARPIHLLPELSEAVGRRYFTHTEEKPHLLDMRTLGRSAGTDPAEQT